MLIFRALPIKDRLGILNVVEMHWEGVKELPRDFMSQTADTWLTDIGQSETACQAVWDPLCQLTIGDSLFKTSAHFFLNMLIQGFLRTRRNHETWLPAQDETSLLLVPLLEKVETTWA